MPNINQKASSNTKEGEVPRNRFRGIIEKVGHWSIFSRPKNGSTSLQNSLFEHCSKSRSASKRRKTAQLRSKTASSTQHNSVLVVTSRSLRGHFAVTSRSQRGHNAVTTRSLRGHYGHYAVTTRSLRSLRSQKKHIFETEKTLNFAPKRPFRSRHCCRRPRRL